MRATPLAFAILLTLGAGSGQAAVPHADASAAPAKAQARSTWIVEFAEPPLATFRGANAAMDAKLQGLKATSPAVTGARRLDVDSKASRDYRAVLAGLRAERLAAAQAALGRTLVPGFEWDVTTHGVTLELTAAEAAKVAAIPGVLRVQPEFVRTLQTDSGPGWINADDVWAGTAGLAPNKGEGQVLGLIDSGINRTHPSFAATGPVDGYVHQNPKGKFYGRCAVTATDCNNKLIGIYDLSTGGDSEETDNGLDVSGHGTHVGATAVGNTLNFTFTSGSVNAQRQLSGVAPHANLISYKACENREDDGSTCVGSWLLAAINQATADGVDVINYSIGGSARDPWTSSDSAAMLAAREAGIVVVVAAGNEGTDGPASVTSPGDAPWVITAANSTHDRAIVNKVTELSGGATPPPGGGTLEGAGATGPLPLRPIVFDPAFPKCSQGDALDEAANGASSPWQPGRFNGQIVVCERGITARVAKSANVRLAGGGGMILVNTAAEAESVVADAHSIPTVHLGFNPGQQLRAWLASGTGHQGRITGATVENSAAYGDILSASSGRGPTVTADGIAKPDITAPGSGIIAAAGTGTGFASLSGTSMATPHIAGASLLLLAGKPDWTPSKVESALITTARNSVRLPDNITPATVFDAGAGTADVAKALTAGLYFEITPAEFRNANPDNGGTPRNLNRPSIVHENCFETCSIARRVTDLAGGGTWRVEFELPAGVTATSTPAQFTLAAGASQPITFTFDVRDPRYAGSWIDGRIRLVRDTGAVQTVPVTLYVSPGTLPASIDLGGPGESGFVDVTFSGLIALPQARFITTDLGPLTTASRTLAQDPSRDDPYNFFTDSEGAFFTLVTVPANPAREQRLRVRTLASSAYDVDLFVGRDVDGDGRPDENEEACTSAGPIDLEFCEVVVPVTPTARTYWILVQNFDAGLQGDSGVPGPDVVTVEALLLDPEPGLQRELVATGPGRTGPRDSFTVRMAWNDPTLLPGERRGGLLTIRSQDDARGEIGPIPVTIARTAPGTNAPALLAPTGTRRMRLAAGAAQDRLYVDVPDNATSLTVSTAGSGEVDLYVARDANPSSPVIAPAPARTAAQGTSIHPGAAETLTITGTALAPGRWYVTPVNTGTTVAEFDLTLALAGTQARPQPRYGAWYNPARSGAGAFLFPANGAWGLAWYTYLQDGTPTWYLGVGPAPGANDGVWRVNLERFAWDGSKATGTVVGQVQLELVDANRFTFSWNLDGESGSEPMVFLDGGGCPTLGGAPAALTGLWYHPAKSGFGYSVNAYPGLESNGAYFYDAQGIARWALGQAAPFGTPTMVMQQRTNGFCPLCTHRVPTASDIGTLTRSYTSASTGSMAIDLELDPPLAGSWTVNLPVQRISDALVCP